MNRVTLEQLKTMRESEDHVEFKKGEGGNVSYNGVGKDKPKERRRCILGYVVALCNEGGGYLVIGMHDSYPHQIIGTRQSINAVGQLESDIYRDLKIRTEIYELYNEAHKRVLVIQIPARPKGKINRFEDVPLMRVGEDLIPMDDKTQISIIQEQEPDFSQQICETAVFENLDTVAISILKKQYARKQKNPQFEQLDDKQALSDLDLIFEGKITNAAVLLVGKEDFINKVFPNAKVMLEYRQYSAQINFDSRKEFRGPFYLLIDELWNEINLRNGNVPIREGSYIFDIPFFNEDVIREAVNNAIAHRDYRCNSEIVIKQYYNRIDIINAGGFPKGVTLDNLLTVPSTPRNRLLADVLSKTGIVERSGQGVDKIMLNTVSEGKPLPDYSHSDDFNVELRMSGAVEDKNFAIYVNLIQRDLPDNNKLSVFDVLTLNDIKNGKRDLRDKEIAQKLFEMHLVEKRGKTSDVYYIMSRRYYELANNLIEYDELTDWDIYQCWYVIARFLENYNKATKGQLMDLVRNHLSEKKLRRYITIFKGKDLLIQEGANRWTIYKLSPNYFTNKDLTNKAVEIGFAELKKRGEL